MGGNNAFCDGQSQPGPVAVGGYKRFEYSFDDILGDTRTIIDHVDLDMLATPFFMRGPDVYGQVAAGHFHRLDCIADQVAENLLQGARVTLDG